MKQDSLALVEPQAVTPMTLIERAASNGASVEMLGVKVPSVFTVT